LAAGAAEQDYSATGNAVTGGTADAIAGADRGPIHSAVEGVYNDTGTAVDSAFAQGFRTETTVRVHANYILENPSMDFRPSYQQGTINVSVAGHASGGFVNGAELSWVGEDGPEAIIPLGMKRRRRGLELYQQVGEILGVAENAAGGVYGGAVYGGGNIANSSSSQPQNFLDSIAFQSETRSAYSGFADMSQDAVSPGTAEDGWQRTDAPVWMFPETGGTFPDFDLTEDIGETPVNPGWTAVSALLRPENGGGAVTSSFSAPQTAADADSGNGVTVEVHVEQHNEYNVDGKDLDEAKVVAIINAHALDNANELAQNLAKELMKALANRPAKGRA
ncbi:MAG: hypothetical protein IJT94_18965, partial [Oscillibacter sp.]|nr:hypothetical protein [Oscillibacter sp.]